MAASEVKSLFAIRQIMSRPRLASHRSPFSVIPPNGNACSAATASRSGAFGSMLSFAACMFDSEMAVSKNAQLKFSRFKK
jgi:hypothetical protein